MQGPHRIVRAGSSYVGWEAIDDAGRVRGFILDQPEQPGRGRAGDWIADTPQVLTALYTEAADAWTRAGYWTHECVFPTGHTAERALLSLGFGHQQAYGKIPVQRPRADRSSDVQIRRGADLDALLPRVPLIAKQQEQSPVFSPRSSQFFDELEEGFREWAAGDDVVIFAHQASRTDRPAGYVALELTQNGPEIALMAVDPNRRGQGIGSALLIEAHRWASARQYTQIRVDWRTANIQAEAFWFRAGAQSTSSDGVVPSMVIRAERGDGGRPICTH
ncbi:GNAT family N-acetyltransferase [Microbacterium sp. K41]|uniref:GNAT family N-acetyltransferase n=1 Tax=Microbacterium sp. K41 TaxID=2305437 RepID=UPI00406C79DE